MPKGDADWITDVLCDIEACCTKEGFFQTAIEIAKVKSVLMQESQEIVPRKAANLGNY